TAESGSKLQKLDTLKLTGTTFPTFADSSPANLLVTTNVGALTSDRTLTGNLRITSTGTVDVGSSTLTTNDLYIDAGASTMSNATAKVVAKGKATFNRNNS